MRHAARSFSTSNRTPRTSPLQQVSSAIERLQSEREILEEEVRQLRAAVQIYQEVVRRVALNGGVPVPAALR